jgi:transposase
VAAINPRHARDFAKGLGLLAKTDQVNTWALVRFAAAVRPEQRELRSEALKGPEEVLTRRRQLVDMMMAERNRQGQASALPIAPRPSPVFV